MGSFSSQAAHVHPSQPPTSTSRCSAYTDWPSHRKLLPPPTTLVLSGEFDHMGLIHLLGLGLSISNM